MQHSHLQYILALPKCTSVFSRVFHLRYSSGSLPIEQASRSGLWWDLASLGRPKVSFSGLLRAWSDLVRPGSLAVGT